MLHALIMAGGSGTRFWPVSRSDTPKQLLNLIGQQSMIQATVARLDGLVPADRTLVVTNERLVKPIVRQLPQLPAAAILGEPCKRDTAPCIGLAAAFMERRNPEAIMVVMPADHVIQPSERFRAAVLQAAEQVERQPQQLVTFGIRPSYPAESFGYIQRGEPLERAPGRLSVYRVKQFREKPSAEVARQYLDSGEFYWNSGIFVWKAKTILEALQKFEPEMAEHLDQIARASEKPRFEALFRRHFEAIKGKSIDYAVMEHYEDVAVIEPDFQWDDVGSWRALARLRGTDDNENTIIGKHIALKTRNSIIRNDDEHLVVTLGMSNCIVVHTPDATLVANLEDEEAIREVVKVIQEKGWTEYL